MLATTTPTNTSIGTYGRSGQPDPLLRSEAKHPLSFPEGEGSTTTEKYKDKVTLSPDGREKSRSDITFPKDNTSAKGITDSEGKTKTNDRQTGTQGLTTAEEKMVRQLKDRDQEVKAHEMAHLASAGQYARGGPSYTYQQGPDGRRYAVGGEVPIDLGKEKSPELTIQKMRAVQQAALAPAEPSSADRSIAATASALENQARQELNTQALLTQKSPSRDNPRMPGNSMPTTSGQTDVVFSRRLMSGVFA